MHSVPWFPQQNALVNVLASACLIDSFSYHPT
jgi:hypothetical protein